VVIWLLLCASGDKKDYDTGEDGIDEVGFYGFGSFLVVCYLLLVVSFS
jgi:hypothetical protein